MIERREGDILQSESEVDALVNTVNCVGVMGRGVALQFRKAYPENYKQYRIACERGEVVPGRMLVYEMPRLHPRYIINFPTKRHWRGKSRIADIESGLIALTRSVRDLEICSIAIPPLGCGLGGLDWNVVRPKIEAAFAELPDVRVLLYEPGWNAAESPPRAQRPAMTIGRAALLGLMRRYLGAVLDPFVSLLEIHKLMYFMQEAGEPLRLTYQKEHYGPYAPEIRHVLNLIEGHFVEGYGDGGDQPTKPIRPLPDALADADVYLDKYPDTVARFERVGALISGFETPFGMELLATVHWVATRDHAATLESAIAKTYEWSAHKRIFEPRHIQIARDTLMEQGWLSSAAPSLS